MSTKDALSTFVPETMKWILQQEKDLKVPYSKQFPSVALFADISGFTNLTEKLSSLPGTLGVETLADEINNYLTLIIKQIVGSGGDIFKFAGDALLCVWPPDLGMKQEAMSQWNVQSLSETVLRVIRCALDIQNTIGAMTKCGVKELTLRVKLGIGVGNVDVLVVGGIMGRFENLPAGEAFFEAFNCENDTPKPKEGEPMPVIISNRCYHMCKQHIAECEPVGSVGNYIVKRISYRINKRRIMKDGGIAGNINYSKDDTLFKKFSRYIPSAVVPHLRMPEQAWVGELRQVTIMFLSLPFNAQDIKNIQQSGGKVLRDIHDSIRSLQTIIYRYQGSLNKFLVDDKGSTVMAVFGLPPVAHRNDPERAVMAALDLKTEFNKKYTQNLVSLLSGAVLDANKTQAEYDRDKNKQKDKKQKNKNKKQSKKKRHQIAIGITSGIVYLGLVGGAGSRREYSVLGDKVNLAARLMGLCKKYGDKYGEIAVDKSIQQKVHLPHILDWDFVNKTKVKGKTQEIYVFKPIPKRYLSHKAIPPIAWLTDASDKHYITECSKVIERLHKESIGRCVWVEGEAGLGKAALIRRVMDQTKNRIWWLWGKGSWIHETKEGIKFPVWRQILLSFQEKYAFYQEKNRKSFENYIMKRRPDLHQWLFLLSYFDLLSFVSPEEYDPNKHIAKEKKDLTTKKLKGSVWERNESAVQKLKGKIQSRMANKDDIREFEEKLQSITDEKERAIERKNKEKELRKEAEGKLDKKLGNFIYDVVLCLLEWAGGKQHARKPIAVVIDGLQWLRRWDWSMTRRLVLMLDKKIVHNVALFISSTPMNIKRYTPHYIKKYYAEQYVEMQASTHCTVINPAPWGIQKTKKYVKTYFKHNHDINVRDVSPKLVETVHSQCGGRPGFCKEFLDILKKRNDDNIKNKCAAILEFQEMRLKGDKKLSFSMEFENFLSSKTQYSSLPIPPVVQAITARHLDVLKPEEMLCLKTAATICISKGTRCLSFLKSTLKGSHPIKQFTEEKKINETLEKLCRMKFITKLPDLEDISHVLNVSGHQKDRTLPCQLYKQSSMINNTQHGHLENHYTHNLEHHSAARALRNGSMDTSIKGRYGGGFNNVVQRNKMHDSVSDGAGFGNLTHLRSASSFSQSAGSEIDDEIKNTKMQDDQNKNKYGDNMPLTSTLVSEPLHNVPWKKGVLNKWNGKMLTKWQERAFVFKGRTLYWFRNINLDKKPLGRIKFDESILRLQLNEKKCETTIKVSRKKYVLKAEDLKEMKEWFELFQNAMNSELNKSNETLHGSSKQIGTIDNFTDNLTDHLTDDTKLSSHKSLHEDHSVDIDQSSMGSSYRQISVASKPENHNNSMGHFEIPDFSANRGECYEFTHGFLRDALYEQMLFTQRIRIHKVAQEYLRKVLALISNLPDYPNKDIDTRDYTVLLNRHRSIASNYQTQQNNIGDLIVESGKSNKRKERKHKVPVFIGLD